MDLKQLSNEPHAKIIMALVAIAGVYLAYKTYQTAKAATATTATATTPPTDQTTGSSGGTTSSTATTQPLPETISLAFTNDLDTLDTAAIGNTSGASTNLAASALATDQTLTSGTSGGGLGFSFGGVTLGFGSSGSSSNSNTQTEAGQYTAAYTTQATQTTPVSINQGNTFTSDVTLTNPSDTTLAAVLSFLEGETRGQSSTGVQDAANSAFQQTVATTTNQYDQEEGEAANTSGQNLTGVVL